jgi:hypothetical protein
MTPAEINRAIAELCGWRPWTFDDPIPRGLIVADKRFNGYKRKVNRYDAFGRIFIEVGDEIHTCRPAELRRDYTPASHFVGKDNEIRRNLPNYHASLDACREFEATIKTLNDMGDYMVNLERAITGVGIRSTSGQFAMITATAAQRCEAFLRMHKKWKE